MVGQFHDPSIDLAANSRSHHEQVRDRSPYARSCVTIGVGLGSRFVVLCLNFQLLFYTAKNEFLYVPSGPTNAVYTPLIGIFIGLTFP